MKRESVGAAWSLEPGHCLDIAVSWDSTTLDTRPAVCSNYLYSIHYTLEMSMYSLGDVVIMGPVVVRI